LNRFIRFPWTVYRDSLCWVPPLQTEVKRVLSSENPFYRHAKKNLFLAWRKDRLVGRIAAIVDDNHITTHSEKVGFFGFFESIADWEVARALTDAAADWLREQGMERILGPMNPSTNEECGFLIDGFDSPPAFMMPYTFPYYPRLMEQLGLQKIKELVAYRLPLDQAIPNWLPGMVKRISRREPGFRVRPVDLKDFQEEILRFKEVYNSAWGKNWGFVPMTDEEFNFMAKRLRPLIVPALILVGLADGQTAGFALTLPDYNQVLIHLRGSLFPLGWLKFFWYRRKMTRIRCMTVGVKAEYRNRGLTALLFLESLKAALDLRYRDAEVSWILEDNLLARRAAEMAGGVVYKRYGLYGKDLF
jgi:GNAT superfamily N-acetyltransferase